LGCLGLAHGLAAENSSLSDSKLETSEAKVTAETLLSQNDLLRKQLSLDRETQKTLTESLVVSNAEAELFRRKYSALQLRIDALGVESVSKDRAKLEQRLLKAVSDLHLLQKEKEAYREQLPKLTETVLRYVKSTQAADPEARMEVETQLRATNQLTAAKGANAPNDSEGPGLMDGKVISVKEEWSLVVGQTRRAAGSKTRDAAASGAGREDDRDFAGGGRARKNQRCGRSGIGFGEGKNKSKRSSRWMRARM
jgi:hypothetical protein